MTQWWPLTFFTQTVQPDLKTKELRDALEKQLETAQGSKYKVCFCFGLMQIDAESLILTYLADFNRNGPSWKQLNNTDTILIKDLLKHRGEHLTRTNMEKFEFYKACEGAAMPDVREGTVNVSYMSIINELIINDANSLLTGLIPEAVVAAAADGGASTSPPSSTRDSTLTNPCRDSEQIGETTHELTRSHRRVGVRWNNLTWLLLVIASHVPSAMPWVTYSRTGRVDIMQMASTCVNKPTDNSQIHPRADSDAAVPAPQVMLPACECLLITLHSNADGHKTARLCMKYECAKWAEHQENIRD